VATDDPDLYQRFETQVRTPKRRLLLDAFLPAAEAIETAVAPPPAPAIPQVSSEEENLLVRLREEEPPPPAKPKAKKKTKAAPAKKEAPKSLQEEVAEFMNRDQTALSPDDDLDSFLNTSLDPNTDPEPKK
jgi:hypothetical protein